MNNFNLRQMTQTIVMLVFALVLVACGKEGETHGKSGQSIVKVNDTEITVHQVNAVLQTAKIDADKKDQASKKIVSGLIDQELLVQAAKDMKLDRNPNVMTAIEAAKKKLLAQAYIQNKVANLSKPTDAEVQTYLKDNPNVFENRKVYAMDEVAFKIQDEQFKSLEALSDSAQTLDEVIGWLSQHDIKFARKKSIHTAERLPKKLLDKMSALQKGELIFVNSPNKVVVGQLIDTRKQPVTLEQSKPLIEMALMNQKRKKAAKAELDRLKKQAEIVYLNKQYKDGAKTKETVEVAESETQVVEEAESGEGNLNEQIEKGLSGL